MPRAFGDDRLEICADGARTLTCSVAKGWHARVGGTQSRSEHPGTAVRWEDGIFEVVEMQPLFERGVRYVLRPWEDRHTIRTVQNYDDASEAQRRSERGRHRSRSGRRTLSILLAPLAGHLPGQIQKEMEGEFGAPASAMTAASALPLFVLGVLGFFANRIAAFGGGSDFLPLLAAHPVVCLFLAAEHGIRLGACFLLGEPFGSLEGTIAWEVWRAATRTPAPPPSAWRGSRATPEQALRDRFRMLEPLLALLTPDEQERLEKRFGFDPLRWGRRSVLFLGVLGALNAFISYGHWLGGGSTPGDAFWFLAGVALLVEQVARRRQIVAGRPAGSALGGIVRPFARGLLA
jgi:hypothetical protein